MNAKCSGRAGDVHVKSKATNTQKVLDRVESLLALLRRQYLWTVEMDVRLLDLPTDEARELLGAEVGPPCRLGEAGATLLQRAVEQ